MTQNPTQRDIKKSIPYMESMSWDKDFEVMARLPLYVNPVTGNLDKATSVQGNASLTLTYDSDGNLQTLTKTIGATTYTKTFTWTNGSLTAVSAWS